MSPTLISVADLDNDGKDDLVGAYGEYGTYVMYNVNRNDEKPWTKINDLNSEIILPVDLGTP